MDEKTTASNRSINNQFELTKKTFLQVSKPGVRTDNRIMLSIVADCISSLMSSLTDLPLLASRLIKGFINFNAEIDSCGST